MSGVIPVCRRRRSHQQRRQCCRSKSQCTGIPSYTAHMHTHGLQHHKLSILVVLHGQGQQVLYSMSTRRDSTNTEFYGDTATMHCNHTLAFATLCLAWNLNCQIQQAWLRLVSTYLIYYKPFMPRKTRETFSFQAKHTNKTRRWSTLLQSKTPLSSLCDKYAGAHLLLTVLTVYCCCHSCRLQAHSCRPSDHTRFHCFQLNSATLMQFPFCMSLTEMCGAQ